MFSPGCMLTCSEADTDQTPILMQAGCTAVVAVVKGNELWVANAGDSRAVLCRGGQALALSEDHKPQSETERNRITAAGGFVSDVGGVSRSALPPSHAPPSFKAQSALSGLDASIRNCSPPTCIIEIQDGQSIILL